jgi:hypothetical protein
MLCSARREGRRDISVDAVAGWRGARSGHVGSVHVSDIQNRSSPHPVCFGDVNGFNLDQYPVA